MTVAVLTEKPSVARDIARVLGATRRGNGILRGNDYAVTWAVGHLVALAEPHQIRPAWRRWSLSSLPLIPERWPLEVVQKTRDRFEVVARLLNDPDVAEVICATDAGREGELIFRYIYEAAGCRKPVRRLWVSSLTEDAIREALANLRPAREYDGLADAARGRSRADWLVGMNLSRAYTLVGGETFSVGRVQTPTLAMLVERSREIRDFVPEEYREVVVTFRPGGPAPTDYEGTWFRAPSRSESPPTVSGEPGAASPETIDADARLRRLPADGEEAERIVARALSGRAVVESLDAKQRKLPPPRLYDLTELQRHANRLFGFSAKKTLDLAQSLYESKKLLSYPRTDSRHLSRQVAAGLPAIVAAIGGPYADDLAPGSGERPLGSRYVDDARVTDHHAIIPTATPPTAVSLSRDEARIYDLVCRRLLAAWHPDHLYSTTTLITAIHDPPPESPTEPGESGVTDRYKSTGTTIDREGWKVLDLALRPRAASPGADTGTPAGAAERRLPAGLKAGVAVAVRDAKSVERKTRPPRHFTDSTLLTGMETAGRTLDEAKLSDAMRETGLGTPATRAAIIETLIQRGYAERSKKSLIATEKGIALIERVHPEVRSPRMTGDWEAKLHAIQSGKGNLDEFMADIESYVRKVVERVGGGRTEAETETRAHRGPRSRSDRATPRDSVPVPDADPGEEPAWLQDGPPPPEEDPMAGWLESEPAAPADSAREPSQQLSLGGVAFSAASTPPRATPARGGRRPTARDRGPARDRPHRKARTPTDPADLVQLLQSDFGFESFRPYQEAVCSSVALGRDVLLVMPTGAGKSLCYQLPGLARGGTTLVVSPLIALMEDQVQKLQEQGFAAERIHSGRKRESSRKACSDYLAGELDFLFIAPERLGVSGFPEMLARAKPTLIAIDEAHCISQWGHDFRPEYRMLGERLPLLRPAPIIALTATATPLVQQDIIRQLGVDAAEKHIHGFRRENIFIELVETRPSARDAATIELLSRPEMRPAIVYAPTRKKAEALAKGLAARMPAAVYHAGIAAARRDSVQARFLGGELEVIVATIAFGMGIDKADVRTVVHTALPGSVEGYYQEIGRAGRDGKPSRAVLFHSYADRRTHEWFLDRDYPEVESLRRVSAALSTRPTPRSALARDLRMDADLVEKAIEKLWVHGGAVLDGDDRVVRGDADWEPPYREQRRHKQEQLDQISRFSEGSGCHMLHLVQHFGDQADSGEPCGHCASCAPGRSVALDERVVTEAERRVMAQIIDALRERDGQSKGRLHRVLFEDTLDRRRFEAILGGLVRAHLVSEEADSFQNEGQTIHFQRLRLTEDGRRAREADLRSLQIACETATPSRTRKRSKRPADGRRAGAPRSFGTDPPEPPKALVDALRSWRLAESKRRRCPAFRILTDRTLMGIASEIPRDEESLLTVKGMGPTLVRKYGDAILKITTET